MSSRKLTRRELVKAGAVAAVGFPYIVRSSSLGLAGTVAPSNRITMGCIGVGGQGTHNMLRLAQLPEVQVVAVCDVERESTNYYGGGGYGLDPAQKRVEEHYSKNRPEGWKGCDKYKDFRELLARRDIDAVTVCTPDHWHAIISVAAANAGKHIYCEKPLANSVAEGRAIVEAVTRNKRVLQTGSHERSGHNARFACELVRNGRIGNLKTIEINLPDDDPHHKQVRQMQHEALAEEPVPGTLDWDFWLGPAERVPYNAKRCHFFWRFILAHGAGEMSDRGAHVIDLAQLGNGTDDTGPIEIMAEGKREPGPGPFDVFWDYKFEFQYASGVRMVGGAKGPRGLKFVGDEGWIFIHVHGARLEASTPSLLEGDPAKERDDLKVRLGRSAGHHQNFIDGIKGRAEVVAPAEVGHRTGSICHLANIAMATGETLKWDPKAEKITNSEAANRMLRPKMREPWTI